MKHPHGTALVILFLSASVALAEDFRTVNGKEYKNATVTRVEADGIIVRTAGGISKIYFVELPKDVADKWLAPIRAAEQAAQEKRIKEQQAAQEKRTKEQQAAQEKRTKEQQAAQGERAAAEQKRAETDKVADANLKQSLEQFESAEQRSSKAYEGAAKGTLSGQVFVSSRGGVNFKLGAVQVGLFARDATDALATAIKKYADYKIQQLSGPVAEAKAAYDQARANESAAFEAELQSISQHGDSAAAKQAHEAAQQAKETALDRYSEIHRDLSLCYSGALYFGFLKSPIRSAETDADGKFVIEVPKTGAFVLAAQARRSVGDDTEFYYWLQPVTLQGQQQFTQNLSNNNLTSTTGTSSLIHTKD